MLCVASPCRHLNCEIIFCRINSLNFERRQQAHKSELKLIVWIIFVCRSECRFYGEHSMGYKIVKIIPTFCFTYENKSSLELETLSINLSTCFIDKEAECYCACFLKFQLSALRFIAFQIIWFWSTIERCGVKGKGISSTPQFKDKGSCVIKSRETTSGKSQK